MLSKAKFSFTFESCTSVKLCNAPSNDSNPLLILDYSSTLIKLNFNDLGCGMIKIDKFFFFFTKILFGEIEPYRFNVY